MAAGTPIATFTHDPDAVLDYTIDWDDPKAASVDRWTRTVTVGPWLADGETISTSTWTVPTGITKDSESETDDTTTIWLSGGTHGTDYDLVNEIVTSAGRTANRTIRIRCRER